MSNDMNMEVIRVDICFGAFEVRFHVFAEWKKIRSSVQGLWATQQTENINCDEDLSAYAKTTIRELAIYLVFVSILSIGTGKIDPMTIS